MQQFLQLSCNAQHCAVCFLYAHNFSRSVGVLYQRIFFVAINIPTFEPSKTALDRVSEEKRDQIMSTAHGMFDYLRINNPDHVLVSGKRANQVGTILYGFEHLGRDVNATELANQLGLAEKQVTNAISRINAIIYPVFGLKIERMRVDNAYTGKLRITNQEDALQACEAINKVLKKKGPDFAASIDSYVNNGGDLDQLVASGALAGLMPVVNQLRPALEPAQTEEAVEV